MSAMQPIRELGDIEKMKKYFLNRGEIRNYVLIVTGINLPVRISDLLGLKWDDVYNFKMKCFKTHLILQEKKTGKKNVLMINDNVSEALGCLCERGECQVNSYIFKAYPHSTEPLTRVAAYQIIKRAADELGLENVGCHSLRKTFGYHAWKQGVHLALIMSIYNHSSIQVTKRYLGIEQDDKDEVMKLMQL